MKSKAPEPVNGARKRDLSMAGAACALLAMAFLLSASPQAAAHSRHAGPSGAAGISFPGLTHGEMAVLAPYSGRIAALARRAVSTDPVFRRLLNYRAIQLAYCGWGVAPGAIRDEESPFNECSHAFLSADKALLLHMRTMSGLQPQADALVSEIENRMVLEGAAFIGCAYSGEEFNTADFVTPHWENLFRHWPTLLLLLAPAGLLASLAAGLYRRNGNPQENAAGRQRS